MSPPAPPTLPAYLRRPANRAAVSCFKYCMDSGATVISASWSAGGQPNPALEGAVREARAAGVLVVAAAGGPGGRRHLRLLPALLQED